MKAYLKVLVPIVITASVSCASNQVSKTDAAIKNETSNHKPSVTYSEKSIKNDVLSAELVEHFVIETASDGRAPKESLAIVQRKYAVQKVRNRLNTPSHMALSQFSSTDSQPNFYQDSGREDLSLNHAERG
jgi:hypothetical protein